MKIGITQIAIIATIVLGGGLLFFLVSQKGNDIEAKYREIVDVFALANELGLDEEQFKKDIDSQEVHDLVASDKSEAETLLAGEISTPAIFINGVVFTQGGTVDELLIGIESKLQEEIDAGNKPELWEFFDYNCIHCANLEKGINQMAADFGDQIVYKKRYLPFLRTSSTNYAYAGEAANRQGKMREFSELLFERIHGV